MIEKRHATLVNSHCFSQTLLPVCFLDLFNCAASDTGCRHPPCCAPAFPTNVPATVSEPSVVANGSAARRRCAGPNTTCALCRGSNSELWQTHFRTSFSPCAALPQAVIGHPAWEQMTEYATIPSADRRRVRHQVRPDRVTTTTSFKREPCRNTGFSDPLARPQGGAGSSGPAFDPSSADPSRRPGTSGFGAARCPAVLVGSGGFSAAACTAVARRSARSCACLI